MQYYQLVEGTLNGFMIESPTICLAEYEQDPTLQIHLQIIRVLHE